MNIIVFMCVGLVAGFLAGKLVEGHGFGVIGDILVGIVGAFIGGAVFTSAQLRVENFWGATFTATLGAVVLLSLAHVTNTLLTPRKSS